MLSINALRNLSRNRVVTSSNKLLKRASPILRGITLGSLVLSLFPSQASCVGEEENKKPNFEKTTPKTSVLDKETFDFNKFIASQLDEKGPFHEVKNFFESGMAGQIGYGFLMGYSSGFCIKKVSKVVAFLLGGSFILVQSLSYSGLIKIDYEGVQKQVEGILDLNKDGKVDIEDVKYAQQKLIDVLGYNMPAGGGFTAGLLAGLKA